MSETKSTAPETLEELRAALRRWVDGTRSYADHVERDAGAYQDAVWRIAIHRDAANQIAALLPEPIKVGDRVQFVDNPRTGTLVAVDEWEAWVRWDVGARTQVAFERLRRVDSSPSPEPEPHGIGLDGRCDECDGPAPSPSPEVGEGVEPHESEDPEELAAAAAAGLTVDFWGVLSKRWMRSGVELSAEGYRRRIGKGERFQIHGTVPGWAEGRELVPVVRALGRTIGGDPVVKWAANRLGDPSAYVMLNHESYGRRVPADPDGKVWVDPLPRQETETVEPHESEDPEELAAAVAAGLTVNPRPPGADWRDRQTYDSTVSAFRDALDYGFRYRIHGTVPGYGETGGAS